MLVYSILAVGLALSPRCTQGPGGASDKALAYDYAQVARFAADRAQMSLQLVQARLLLAVYYLTISRPRESNDMSSAAISAATCIQLNLELDVSTDASLEAFPYGLNRAGYEETRRRTFWSCFLLERLNGLFPSRMSMINVDDIFIRLPVPARSFEALADLPTPQFDQAQSNIEENGADIMGSLVTLVAIWAEVMTTAYRVSHRTSASEFDFVEYFARMDQKLTRWHRSLKSPHVFSAENLEQTIRENELGTFVTMHLLYHLTMLKLNRHVHSRFLALADPHGAARKFWHVAAAKDHASKILDAVAMIRELAARRPDYPISPLASYAVVEALDVLSAEGLVDDIGSLVDRLAAGKDVQMSLSSIWEGVGAQANALRDRISLLRRIQDQAASQSQSAIPGSYTFVNREEPTTKGQLPTGVCWRLTEPLETRFPKLMDVIYNQRAPSPHITPSAAD